MKLFHKRNPQTEDWIGAYIVWQSDSLRYILFFIFLQKGHSYIFQMFKQFPFSLHYRRHDWQAK